MKTLQSGNALITVVVNKSADLRRVDLKITDKSKKPVILFADKKGTVSGQTISISPEETLVVEWK